MVIVFKKLVEYIKTFQFVSLSHYVSENILPKYISILELITIFILIKGAYISASLHEPIQGGSHLNSHGLIYAHLGVLHNRPI